MQFVIIGRGGLDEGALDRRMASRQAHVALGDEMYANGTSLIGGAILDDDGQMVGSVRIVDFPSREALDEYLQKEPYVTGDVWRDIEILPFQLGPSYTKR